LRFPPSIKGDGVKPTWCVKRIRLWLLGLLWLDIEFK
jgi:hypothetical protein